MMINLIEDENHNYGELVQRQNKILGNMLGCEVDFIVKGLDSASRSIVASRKDAMYKSVRSFICPLQNTNSRIRVCEDRIVQARVIAVAEKSRAGRNLWCGMFYPGPGFVLGLAGRCHRTLSCGRTDSGKNLQREV